MEKIFLPRQVKSQLEELMGPDSNPTCIIRSNGSLTGKSGEGYIIGFPSQVLLFSKIFGEKEFHSIVQELKSISILDLRQEKYCSMLEIQTPDKDFCIKISRLEDDDCQKLINLWNTLDSHAAPRPIANSDSTAPPSSTTTTASPPPMPEAPPKAQEETLPPPLPSTSPTATATSQASISPIVGMAAMLMYLSTVDGEIDQSEDDYIRKACSDNTAILQTALNYYKTHSVEELQTEFKLMNLDNQQKLCIFANMCELGMSDGVLHSIEQKLIYQVADILNISQEETQAIRDVLLVKNQMSVLVS